MTFTPKFSDLHSSLSFLDLGTKVIKAGSVNPCRQEGHLKCNTWNALLFCFICTSGSRHFFCTWWQNKGPFPTDLGIQSLIQIVGPKSSQNSHQIFPALLGFDGPGRIRTEPIKRNLSYLDLEHKLFKLEVSIQCFNSDSPGSPQSYTCICETSNRKKHKRLWPHMTCFWREDPET